LILVTAATRFDPSDPFAVGPGAHNPR